MVLLSFPDHDNDDGDGCGTLSPRSQTSADDVDSILSVMTLLG